MRSAIRLDQVYGLLPYEIMAPPFDRDDFDAEAYRIAVSIYSRVPIFPVVHCGLQTFWDLREAYVRRAVREQRHFDGDLRLAGMHVNMVTPNNPLYRFLAKLERVDMEKHLVVAALSNSLLDAIFSAAERTAMFADRDPGDETQAMIEQWQAQDEALTGFRARAEAHLTIDPPVEWETFELPPPKQGDDEITRLRIEKRIMPVQPLEEPGP